MRCCHLQTQILIAFSYIGKVENMVILCFIYYANVFTLKCIYAKKIINILKYLILKIIN